MKTALLLFCAGALASASFAFPGAESSGDCCDPQNAKCSPTGTCTACSDCSKCKHCKAGGSCSVCKKDKDTK